MNIFITWSGNTSYQVATEIANWLKGDLRFSVNTFISKSDIQKGGNWFNGVTENLENADYAIVCLTRENLDSPWLNFEAGFLSHSTKIKSDKVVKVVPFLFGLKLENLQNHPLTQLQVTEYDKDDIKQMVKHLNSYMKPVPIEKEYLELMFESKFPKLQQALDQLLTQIKNRLIVIFEQEHEQQKAEVTNTLEQILDEERLHLKVEEWDREQEIKSSDIVVYIFKKTEDSIAYLKQIIDMISKQQQDIPLIVYTDTAFGDKRLESEEFSLFQSVRTKMLANFKDTLKKAIIQFS